jgi:hypothetical protein
MTPAFFVDRTGHALKDRRAAASSKLLQLQYTEHGRESASCNPMKLNSLDGNSRFPLCRRILRVRGTSTNAIA